MNRHLAQFSLCVALLCSASPLAAQAAKPPAPRAPAVKVDSQNGYNLAFVEADVRRVIDAVLGSMLELDYSVDPAVQGSITLRTNQPVARESLLPLLESALRSVDAVIVVQGASHRVLPRAEARSRAPLSQGGAQGPVAQGFATDVVSLKNASAREIARVLEQFLGKEVVAGTDNARNQVLISGSGEERQAARQLIERFDVDAFAKMNFELYRLENVDAGVLLTELERIFQPPFDIIGSRVRIVPLPRLRSVLAIAAERGDLTRIEPWIRRLDAGASGKRKLYNYVVQNGRARDIAASLQLVLGGSGGSGGGGGMDAAASSPASTSTGTSSASQGGTGDAAAGGDAGGVQTQSAGMQSGAVGGGGGPRVVPNDSNNSLLIYADGEEYSFVREALEKLDQPVAQVLIEATLAEVTLTDDLRFGVDFSIVSGNDKVINTGTRGGTGAPAPIFPGTSVSIVGSSVQAVLNTLQSKTNVRVLSAPKLIVLNNQTATLQVGDQVPIVTQQSQGTGAPGAPIVNSIELRDTGVILKVTPRVNDSGTITLDISQEVSDVAETTTSGINSPTIQQRRLASTVSTRAGQMIALGGLIRDRVTRTKSGIPLLSQIPVIGGVFGREANGGTRTELIVLLTPTVIRSPDEVRNVVNALLDGLDATRPLIERANEIQVSKQQLPPPPPPRASTRRSKNPRK